MTNGQLLTHNRAVLGPMTHSVSYFNVRIRYVQYQWQLINPPVVDTPTIRRYSICNSHFHLQYFHFLNTHFSEHFQFLMVLSEYKRGRHRPTRKPMKLFKAKSPSACWIQHEQVTYLEINSKKTTNLRIM